MTAVTVQAGGCRSVIPAGRQFDAQILVVASVEIVELGTEVCGKSEGWVVNVRVGFPDRFIRGCEDLAPSRHRAIAPWHMGRYDAATVLVDMFGHQLAPWTVERALRTARGTVPGLPVPRLRHYLASVLIASGSEVKVVQARLRHPSARTTLATYGHLWPDSDDSTRTAVEAVLSARGDSCGQSAD